VSGTFFGCLCKALASRPVEKPRKPVLSLACGELVEPVEWIRCDSFDLVPCRFPQEPFFPISRTPLTAYLKAQSRLAGTPTSLKKRFQTASRSGHLRAACTQAAVCDEAHFTSTRPTEYTKMSETLRPNLR